MGYNDPEYSKYLQQAKILYQECYANDNVGDGKITAAMLRQAQTSATLALACLLEDVFIKSGVFAHVEMKE